MYGFTILKGVTPYNQSERTLSFSDCVCVNNMIHKFEGDKIFTETDEYIVILDGITLNKTDLCKGEFWYKTVIQLYESYGDSFCSYLRGCFCGAIYDKKKDKWVIFTDHLGQRYIYYYVKEGKLICSPMMSEIYNNLRANGIVYHMDKKAPYMILTYGYMLEGYTLCEEVRKIQPGCYITYENCQVAEHNYYQLKNDPNNLTEEECIEKLDALFRKAVALQYNKDKEYGYKHICALSAGLDCRMTTFVAHELGFTRQMNVTFSESGFSDEYVPKKMARALKHEWIYKALDNGMWLYEVDKITRSTCGNVLFMGVAHGDSLFRYMNFSELGMIHSGQLGDVTIGTHMKDYNEKFEPGEGAYSVKYIKYLDFEYQKPYPNKEIGSWYNRYLNGAINGQQNEYNYTETFSPFTDLDFLEFCLSIPVKYRYNHHIYKKWIVKKYPLAASFEWDKLGAKLTAPCITINNKQIALLSSPSRLFRKVLVKFGIAPESFKKGMNPIASYLKTNKELSDYLDSYYDNLNVIEDVRLCNILKDIKENGNSLEKNQAVSLLAAAKMYFN